MPVLPDVHPTYLYPLYNIQVEAAADSTLQHFSVALIFLSASDLPHPSNIDRSLQILQAGPTPNFTPLDQWKQANPTQLRA